MWQLCVVAMRDGKNYTITIEGDQPGKTTVDEFKRLVQGATGIEAQYIRLQYKAEQLERGKRLSDYGISDGDSFVLVLRLPGGGNYFSYPDETMTAIRSSGNSPRRVNEPCMITMESDDSYKMPCGHVISPGGLMNYIWNEISERIAYEINCPQCGNQWSQDAIKEVGKPSEMELQQLQIGLAKNYCVKNAEIRECPFCKNFCERQNPSSLSVKCIVCSKASAEPKIFCWICLKSWKNSSLSANSCGNPGCADVSEILKRLKESPKVTVRYINIEIYKLRACPNCGILIEYDGECKHMRCLMCRKEFCIVCLRLRMDGSWPCGQYNAVCQLAPIQTTIPKAKK